MQELALIQDPVAAASLLKPPRPAILECLREPDSAAGAARTLGMPRQQVAYHVRELEKNGLLRKVGERRVRNCMERVVQATARRYLLAPTNLGALGPSPQELADRFSSAYLVARAARLGEDVARMREEAAAAGLKLATLTLETQVQVRSPAAQHAFVEELQAAITQVVKRHHDPGEGSRAFDLTTFVHPGRDSEPEQNNDPGASHDH